MGTKEFPVLLLLCVKDLKRPPGGKRWNSSYRACAGSIKIDLVVICYEDLIIAVAVDS